MATRSTFRWYAMQPLCQGSIQATYRKGFVQCLDRNRNPNNAIDTSMQLYIQISCRKTTKRNCISIGPDVMEIYLYIMRKYVYQRVSLYTPRYKARNVGCIADMLGCAVALSSTWHLRTGVLRPRQRLSNHHLWKLLRLCTLWMLPIKSMDVRWSPSR